MKCQTSSRSARSGHLLCHPEAKNIGVFGTRVTLGLEQSSMLGRSEATDEVPDIQPHR